MANIKQQEKRVRVATRQRAENLRFRSTVKTLMRRLETAVQDGDAETIAAAHRDLVRWLDKAASQGALHANTAARRKSQAAKLAGSTPAAKAPEKKAAAKKPAARKKPAAKPAS
jgi:small subunit ribosomal protein S20